VAIGLLSRVRDRPNFGNTSDVENLISHTKAQEQIKTVYIERRELESGSSLLAARFR